MLKVALNYWWLLAGLLYGLVFFCIQVGSYYYWKHWRSKNFPKGIFGITVGVFRWKMIWILYKNRSKKDIRLTTWHEDAHYTFKHSEQALFLTTVTMTAFFGILNITGPIGLILIVLVLVLFAHLHLYFEIEAETYAKKKESEL